MWHSRYSLTYSFRNKMGCYAFPLKISNTKNREEIDKKIYKPQATTLPVWNHNDSALQLHRIIANLMAFGQTYIYTSVVTIGTSLRISSHCQSYFVARNEWVNIVIRVLDSDWGMWDLIRLGLANSIYFCNDMVGRWWMQVISWCLEWATRGEAYVKCDDDDVFLSMLEYQ